MSDKKNEVGVLDPKDLMDPDLSLEDAKLLDMRKFLIQGGDTTLFDSLPLDNKQKAEMLRQLAFVKQED